MILGKTIVYQLQQCLLNQKGVSEEKEGNYIFNRNVENLNFQLTVQDFDKFSFLLENLQIEISKESPEVPLDVDDLKKRAEFLAKKVTYLLENFEVFEIDPVNLKIQLRSISAQDERVGLSYFEIIVQGNASIPLARILFDKGKKQKQRIPFHLTNEVLEKLINDVVKTIQSQKFE